LPYAMAFLIGETWAQPSLGRRFELAIRDTAFRRSQEQADQRTLVGNSAIRAHRSAPVSIAYTNCGIDLIHRKARLTKPAN